MPACSVAERMSSTLTSVAIIDSRSAGGQGAIEKPQLPATTEVTPSWLDGLSAGSHSTCGS